MSKKNFKLPVYFFITIILTFGLTVTFQSILAAWSNPTQAPVQGNPPGPIFSQSTNNQIISGGGGLGVQGPLAAVDGSFSGRVGIGISNPNQKLDVNGGGRFFGSATANSGRGVEIDYGGIVAGTGRVMAYDRDSTSYNPLRIEGSTLALNFASGGNVGIGTDNPNHKLDVNGDVGAHNFTSGNGGQVQVLGTGGIVNSIRSVGTADITLRVAGTDRVRVDNNGDIVFLTDTDVTTNPAGTVCNAALSSHMRMYSFATIEMICFCLHSIPNYTWHCI